MDLHKPARHGRAVVPVRLLSVGAVVAVLVAGCGGSSKPSTTTTKARKVSTVANTTLSTPSSSSAPTFASASNCTALSGVGEQFAKAMESATSGGKFNLDAAVKAYQNLANAAPAAIKPDIQELASAFTAYASVLSKANFKFGSVPSASQITALESAAKDLSASKMETASKAVEAWAVKNCSA
jgi:hypothetical protein